MNGNPLYAEEKFAIALHVMATGQGILQDRLLSAYLSFHTVREDDLPEYLHEDYSWIVKSLTDKPAMGDEGTLAATLVEMSGDDAQAIARRIYELTAQLRDYNQEQNSS